MPSLETYIQQVEELKVLGNDAFIKKVCNDAIQYYNQAIVVIDRIPEITIIMNDDTSSNNKNSSNSSNNSSSDSNATLQLYNKVRLLKSTLLSNRAAARIKRYETSSSSTTSSISTVDDLQEAIQDCQSSLVICNIVNNTTTSTSNANANDTTTSIKSLRSKVLYRSAKARFLLANHTNSSNSSNTSTSNNIDTNELLQSAAKDLLLLLQIEPKHTEGNQLMKMIRMQHQQITTTTSSTPISKVLYTLLSYIPTSTSSNANDKNIQQQLKMLLGLIQNDPIHTSMEIGRYNIPSQQSSSSSSSLDIKNGLDLLFHFITLSSSSSNSNTSIDYTIPILCMQCISTMASYYPVFVRTYLLSYQTVLTTTCESILHTIIAYHHDNNSNNSSNSTTTTPYNIVSCCDYIVSILSIWHSIILHADRDNTGTTIEHEIIGTSKIQYTSILHTISYTLYIGQYIHQYNNNESSTTTTQTKLIYRAVLDIISVFLAGNDRDHQIRMSLINHSTSSNNNSNSNNNNTTTNIHKIDPDIIPIKSIQEIRNLSPQDLASYKKRQYDIKTRNEAWAFERANLICTTNININANILSSASSNLTSNNSILQQLLQVAVSYCMDDIIVRREITISISKIISCFDTNDDIIKKIVRPFLQQHKHKQNGKSIDDEPYIQEIYNDDDDDTGKVYDISNEEKNSHHDDNTNVSLEIQMIRTVLATAILLLSTKKECATWVLSVDGWTTVNDDINNMIQSEHIVALCYVVEFIQAAAILEGTRTIVMNLISNGAMESLMKSSNRDVRSGAAAAIAKLGLSDKVTSKDDGELMGLLLAACELFQDNDDDDENVSKPTINNKKDNNTSKVDQYSSYATTSVERAVEMITYLVAHTTVKDEIANGFGGSSGKPVINLLVQAADQPGAGESMSGFSLASIFQLMAATNEQIRREAFEGKEVTMEQYDEMQRMGKTEEEKEIMDQEKDTDTKEACHDRIRMMANANVPRALVALTENASEHTLEQLAMAMNRMADEPSVRGIMIQQGVLSACIKIDKAEGPTETEIMKKVIRMARHTIAKMLITTNPSLLTSAQKLGAVRPLILLVRDLHGSDLQHFEALLAITNIGSSGDDAKNRIVSEKGISSFHFAMFSDHEMVRRAATEALCNLVPHEKMMDHLSEVDHLRLWLAFATDYEDHYECARAAAGCLAMATQDETIAETLSKLEKFKVQMTSILESGRLEIMHRAFVIVYNLVLHGGEIRTAAIQAGLIDFCRAYIELQQHSVSSDDFSIEERQLLPITVDIAKKIVLAAD